MRSDRRVYHAGLHFGTVRHVLRFHWAVLEIRACDENLYGYAWTAEIPSAQDLFNVAALLEQIESEPVGPDLRSVRFWHRDA